MTRILLDWGRGGAVTGGKGDKSAAGRVSHVIVVFGCFAVPAGQAWRKNWPRPTRSHPAGMRRIVAVIGEVTQIWRAIYSNGQTISRAIRSGTLCCPRVCWCISGKNLSPGGISTVSWHFIQCDALKRRLFFQFFKANSAIQSINQSMDWPVIPLIHEILFQIDWKNIAKRSMAVKFDLLYNFFAAEGKFTRHRLKKIIKIQSGGLASCSTFNQSINQSINQSCRFSRWASFVCIEWWSGVLCLMCWLSFFWFKEKKCFNGISLMIYVKQSAYVRKVVLWNVSDGIQSINQSIRGWNSLPIACNELWPDGPFPVHASWMHSTLGLIFCSSSFFSFSLFHRSPSDAPDHPRGSIRLKGTRISTEETLTFAVHKAGDQTFHLKASSEVERQRWITAIELAKTRALKGEESSGNEAEGLSRSSLLSSWFVFYTWTILEPH